VEGYLFFSVETGEKEVVVAVWEAFDLIVPFKSGCCVEFLADIFSHWENGDVETGCVSKLDPVFVWGSLDIDLWPVPTSLGFKDMKLTVNSHGDDRMA